MTFVATESLLRDDDEGALARVSDGATLSLAVLVLRSSRDVSEDLFDVSPARCLRFGV